MATDRMTLPRGIRSSSGFAPAIGLTALLSFFYAHFGGAFALGFVVLVPWMLSLRRVSTWIGALASGIVMAMAFVLAVFHWFGTAFGAYVGIDSWLAIVLLVLLAPLLQPQFVVFALVRHAVVRRCRVAMATGVAAASWAAMEWLFPKLLGDTLAHGLQPSIHLRQAADLFGTAGLTIVLLLVNESIATAMSMWREHRRGTWSAIGVALVLIVATAGYGFWRLADVRAKQTEPANAVRVGLIQANITDVERLRAELGAYAVIRRLLDTHFMMSAHAVRDQGADVVVWSETIYPTTFGSPKSEDGAALDQEIIEFGRELGVPLVFGTYDRDDAGEYNAAAFVAPERGLLGHYRKTHPFPFTETIPAWLESDHVRRLLPWTGSWRAGNGARAFPLRTADGREVNVVPLICLDDVKPQLAIDGARLGAQALIGLSNDSWFTAYPAGARLHLAVASFRSIETRLPQLRVTTNGLSALIDETGTVLANTDMGQQAVLTGEIPVRDPMPTLMVRFGDWTGPASLVFLGAFCVVAWSTRRRVVAHGVHAPISATEREMTATTGIPVVLLTPVWRKVVITLRGVAVMSLLWIAMKMIWRDGFQINASGQYLWFGFGVVMPWLLGSMINGFHAYRASIVDEALVFARRGLRIEIPLQRIVGLPVWRSNWPMSGVDVRLASGQLWSHSVVVADPLGLQRLLVNAGAPLTFDDLSSQARARSASARAFAHHGLLDHAVIKFVLYPLLLALPAFRLHQVITFGGMFGEWQTFGAGAWWLGLLIWWASWAIGLALLALVLRLVVEAVLMGIKATTSIDVGASRLGGERAIRVVYYLAVPIWFAVRLLSA